MCVGFFFVFFFNTGIPEFSAAVDGKTSKLITSSCSKDMPLRREAMRECFSALMYHDKDQVTKELNSLVVRLNDMSE